MRTEDLNPSYDDSVRPGHLSEKMESILNSHLSNLSDNGFSALPKYRSHKVVGALKIKAVEVISTADKTYRLTFEEPEFAGHEFVYTSEGRPVAQIGHYLVIYQDGYYSCSPAKQFEEGYSQITS